MTGVRLSRRRRRRCVDRRRAGAATTDVDERPGRAHGRVLELHGGELDASERRLLDVIVAQLEAALEHGELAETAARGAACSPRPTGCASALLAAVGHDLRRPLAVGVGRRQRPALARARSCPPSDRDELLATADESLDSLADARHRPARRRAACRPGVLAVALAPVDVADVVLAGARRARARPRRRRARPRRRPAAGAGRPGAAAARAS